MRALTAAVLALLVAGSAAWCQDGPQYLVVKVTPSLIYLDGGQQAGIEAGDDLVIMRPDPSSSGFTRIAEVRVLRTFDRMAIAEVCSTAAGAVIEVLDFAMRPGPSDRHGPPADAGVRPAEPRALEMVPEAGARASETIRLEPWYTYWGLGWANVTYPGELDRDIEELSSLLGPTHAPVSISLDLLGFYLPIGRRQLLGIVLNCSADRYEEAGNSIQLNGYLVSASNIGFARHIGEGVFYRFDIGVARNNLQVDADEFEFEGDSDWGYGALAGGGYALPVWRGTSILLNANYALRQINSKTTRTLGLSVGGLF